MVGPGDLLKGLPGGNPNLPGRQPQQQGGLYSAQPPQPTNTIPRSGQVIKYNRPVQTNDRARLSAYAARVSATDSMEKFDLEMMKKAHMDYIMQTGGDMKPLPFERDIKVGNTVIPKELVRRIGQWSLKIPPPRPEHLKRPDEVW